MKRGQQRHIITSLFRQFRLLDLDEKRTATPYRLVFSCSSGMLDLNEKRTATLHSAYWRRRISWLDLNEKRTATLLG